MMLIEYTIDGPYSIFFSGLESVRVPRQWWDDLYLRARGNEDNRRIAAELIYCFNFDTLPAIVVLMSGGSIR
jgi:hypothetical protein